MTVLIVERIGRLEDISAYHDYQNSSGKLSFYSRIILGLIFFKGIRFPTKFKDEVKKIEEKKEEIDKNEPTTTRKKIKFSRFRLKFLIISFFYIISLPIAQIIVERIPVYLRHGIMTYCLLFIQWSGLIIFGILLYGKDNQFYSEIIIKEEPDWDKEFLLNKEKKKEEKRKKEERKKKIEKKIKKEMKKDE